MRKMVLAVVVVTGVSAACPRIEALAEADLLQQAINYVFTGTTDPKEGPEIADRKSCIVVIRDPRFPRFIRYYLSRFRPDNTRIGKKYAGVRTQYELDVESDSIIIEYLSLDKATVIKDSGLPKFLYLETLIKQKGRSRLLASTASLSNPKPRSSHFTPRGIRQIPVTGVIEIDM